MEVRVRVVTIHHEARTSKTARPIMARLANEELVQSASCHVTREQHVIQLETHTEI